MDTKTYLEFTLRVACLHFLVDRLAQQRPSSISDTGQLTLDTLPDAALTNHAPSPALDGDFLKGLRFPDRLLKTLDDILPKVAMGQEAKYQDQRFRRIIASFWSSSWHDKTFQRQLRESRRFEDLIVHFVTAATKSLKKEGLQGDKSWMIELNAQLVSFLDLIEGALRALNVPLGDVLTRLKSYRSLILTPRPNSSMESQSPSIPATKVASSRSWQSMADDLCAVFGIPNGRGQDLLAGVESMSTMQAALKDAKTCLKLLNADIGVPYGPADFDSTQAWEARRSREIADFQQIVLDLLALDTDLVKSIETSESDWARLEGLHLNDKEASAAALVFVPPEPEKAYSEVLDAILDWDLNQLQSIPEDQEVSLGILSEDHQILLAWCARQWRLPDAFRAWTFLGSLVKRFTTGSIPSQCLHQASSAISQVLEEDHLETWSIPDRNGLREALRCRDISLLRATHAALMASMDGVHSSDFIEAVIDCDVPESQHGQRSSYEETALQLEDALRETANRNIVGELEDRRLRLNRDTSAVLLEVAHWIQREVKWMRRTFEKPVFDLIDVTAVVFNTYHQSWLARLAEWLSHDLGSVSMDRAASYLSLFPLARRLEDIASFNASQFPSTAKESTVMPVRGPIYSRPTSIFAPVVRAWLGVLTERMRDWAKESIVKDTFQPIVPNGPSSSVTDLFASFRGAAQVVQSLEWPNELELASFISQLTRIFSVSLHDYCSRIEQLFVAEMSSTDSTQSIEVQASAQRAWLDRAKTALDNLHLEKKVPFFTFASEMCVKLNNIEAARQQLDALYEELRVDELPTYDSQTPTSLHRQPTISFTVKIVAAQGLRRSTGAESPGPFVILSDQQGHRFAKTRSAFDESEPRWDQTFDIEAEGPLWLMASIKQKQSGRPPITLGKTYLHLDPESHSQQSPDERFLSLDTGGTLMLRITVELQGDDSRYNFGKAFRSLKRTESAMTINFVEKMTPVLHRTLSRTSIKAVLRPRNGPLTAPIDYNDALERISAALPSVDYNKAIVNMSAAYKSAIGNVDYSIPKPATRRHDDLNTTFERPQATTSVAKLSHRKGLRDGEIEKAIHPLFDYLEANMSTMASSLSRPSMQTFMAKLWKQILSTIQALIMPSLSAQPSELRPLSGAELEVALKWLTFLRNFLHLNGDENGLPEAVLNNDQYNELLKVALYYDWSTDDLMEECVRGFQNALQRRSLRPGKSLLSQRNLGTIRARKTLKRAMLSNDTTGSPDMIMRILRMRMGTEDFLTQLLGVMSAVKINVPHG